MCSATKKRVAHKRKEDCIKKKLVVAAAATAIGLSAVLGVGLASAQSQSSGQSTLVDQIAQKFNLNKNDVQKVFDDNRAEHEAKREQNMKARLDQAVKDGKLTQAQEDQILAKLQEMKTFMDSLKDKTPEERHAAMKTKHDELIQWAKDNNIPEQYVVRPGGHRGGGPEPL